MISENFLLPGDILNIKGNYPGREPLISVTAQQTHKKNGNKFLYLIIMLLILTAGCATQHKYKKYKPIPCPCEKENKK
jgi:hypothetical protein